MRFTAEGPSLPDKLLRARDEGRVVFFCGAGVSRARAGLADFFGLAASVIQELGAPEHSDASKVLRKAKEVGDELEVTGLISADRVFSLLERDFTTWDIQSAVAKSLAPVPDVDRSAHEILLRLSRTPRGKIQLVTTNFDRLFESDGGKVPLFQPPRLPQPSRYDDLDGIVYLHGRVNADYTQADGTGFVLSSSDFGHAYLSEGWATEFFREIVRRYVVVFVGYSADDPPVHYLLEGLRRHQDSQYGLYAFQSNGTTELTARWKHKGVEPIEYSDVDRHRALWETLECWASRADEPQKWQQSVIDCAMAGPRVLKPYQRGQVSHIVSTYEGVKAFADTSPPAEWLCVFDPQCRFEPPRQVDFMTQELPTLNPFDLYGLDSDEIPQRSGDNSFNQKREVPSDAWDVFEFNDLDRQELSLESFPAVRGKSSFNIPTLPPRLSCLGTWIATVANQAAALWWAVRQDSLHPDYRRTIEWKLSQRHEETDETILRIWNYLLEAWSKLPADEQQEDFEFERYIEKNGWSLKAVRQFVKLSEPYLKVGPVLISSPVPPTLNEEFGAIKLARIQVVCPVPQVDVDIPDEWLYPTVRGLRSCLEAAARLFEEADDYHGRHISPLEKEEHSDISEYQRSHGLSGSVIKFASLFERLATVNARFAKEELSAWPSDDCIVFARLRFWANGKPDLVDPDTFARVLLELSDCIFWGSYHQRDLLILLAKRWSDITDNFRHEIERRILNGPSRYEGEEHESYQEHLAWSVLTRLQWLKIHGCEFSFDVESEILRLRPQAPAWIPEYAEHAADSNEIRGGSVATDKEHSVLLREPIDTILSKSLELSGRSHSDHLIEHDPFAGLCTVRPKRAYLALVRAARRDEYPEWAWTKFLNSDSRGNDRSEFSAVIATRLRRSSGEMLLALIYPTTRWLQKISKSISSDFPDVFDQIVLRFIDILKANPDVANSDSIGPNRIRDWITEAINSPVGNLIRALFDDARQDLMSIHVSLTPIEKCLSLPNKHRLNAIAMTSHHLGWLHSKAADWTEKHLLAILDGNEVEDQEAFWAGFFWNPHVSSPALYLRMKDGMLHFAKDGNPMRAGHVQSLAYLLLTGWLSSANNESRRWVNNSEFRDVLLHGGDELRSHVLWQFQQGIRNKDTGKRGEWQLLAKDFFSAVWPRQRSVKTQRMTVRIVEILLSNSDGFIKLIDVVSPLLTTLQDSSQIHIDFRDEIKSMINSHPERFLHLLHVVLSEDVRKWPYGIRDALKMIGEADDSLLADDRLRDLQRRWDAR